MDVVPKGVEEAAAGPRTDRVDAPVGEKVIDAAYRELNIKPAAEQRLESAEQQVESAEQQAESAEQQAESVEYQPEMEEQHADIVEAGTYTNIEIKNAISYFDIEYLSRMGVQQDATKRRNYRIALECIRRCYPSIAEQTAE